MNLDLSEIEIHLDLLLVQRKMKLNTLSELTGIQINNLSILKNNKAKAIRFSTLSALCRALKCQPGDLMSFKDHNLFIHPEYSKLKDVGV